jgi:hypothetical protein
MDNTSLGSISTFINSLSVQGAAWYQGVTGTPVLSGAIAASASTTRPVSAGLLANPTIIIVGLLVLGLILYLALGG